MTYPLKMHAYHIFLKRLKLGISNLVRCLSVRGNCKNGSRGRDWGHVTYF